MAICGGFRPKGKPRFYAVGVFSSINDIPDNKAVRDLYNKGGVEKWSPRAETTVLPELVQSQFDEYCKEHFVSAAERERICLHQTRGEDMDNGLVLRQMC
jgi:hypothetical protein